MNTLSRRDLLTTGIALLTAPPRLECQRSDREEHTSNRRDRYRQRPDSSRSSRRDADPRACAGRLRRRGPGEPEPLRRRRGLHRRPSASSTSPRARLCDARRCTPAYLGRDPQLLRRLAKASGVRLITNTATTAPTTTSTSPTTPTPRAPSSSPTAGRASGADGIEGTVIPTGPSWQDRRRWGRTLRVRREARARRRPHPSPDGPHDRGAYGRRPRRLSRRSPSWRKRGCRPPPSSGSTRRSSRTGKFTPARPRRGAWVEFDGVKPGLRCRRAREDGSRQ